MKIRIQGLDCPNCAKKLENGINKIDGISNCKIDFLKSSLEFESKNNDKAVKDIIKITNKLEPDARIILPKSEDNQKNKILIDIFFLGVGIILALICFFVQLKAWAFWTIFVLSALCMGYKVFYKTIVLLKQGTINENLLVTISVIGAALVGEHHESLMVLGLYSIGKILEGMAVNKSRKSIKALTNFKPEFAVVLKDGNEVTVLPEDVKVGDELLIRPGERVCVDGILIDGSANLDMKSLTGESVPYFVGQDDEILSGSIVLDGVIKIRATRLFDDSTVSTIINLIETASDKKSKTETFISKITRWYTLGVIILATLVWAIVWAITKNFDTAIYRGLIFLVISCPCAFAISVPLSYFSGIGNSSKNGILIKGSNYLDALAKLDLIAFDKTGTITSGDFEIEDIEIIDKKYNRDEVLFLASLGEQYSLHPLARAICRNGDDLPALSDVKEVAGEGVYYTYEDNSYFVGKFENENTETLVQLQKNQKTIAVFHLKDKIKDSSRKAIKRLEKLKVKTVMLSGDSNEVVKNVASAVGIHEAYSGMLPKDKYEWLKKRKESTKERVGFVGDGLNDAPSLMLSDVGICMGIKGNASSIEASDLVISNDNLEKIPDAIQISKYTRKIVWENIIFSAIVKVTFLTLGAFGVTGMLSAVIADVGVTVLAILNSLRALTHKVAKDWNF